MNHEVAIEHLGGHRALKLMVNAREFVAGPKSLRFRFSGARGMNVCVLTLDEWDLYGLEIWQVGAGRCRVKHERGGLFFDDVRGAFEAATGLSLRVPTVLAVRGGA